MLAVEVDEALLALGRGDTSGARAVLYDDGGRAPSYDHALTVIELSRRLPAVSAPEHLARARALRVAGEVAAAADAVEHAIARGDFSRRIQISSRTEIGDLAETFNLMTDDLEKYVEQLKQAANENHELFLGSIRTLAAAIDGGAARRKLEQLAEFTRING